MNRLSKINFRKVTLGAFLLAGVFALDVALAVEFHWQITDDFDDPVENVTVCLDEDCSEEVSDEEGNFTIDSSITSEGWYTLSVYDADGELVHIDDIFVTGSIEYDSEVYFIRPQP